MFWTRLASSIVIILVAAASLILGGAVMAFVVMGISMIGFHELCTAFRGTTEEASGWRGPEVLGILGIAAYFFAAFFSGDMHFLMMAVVGTFLGEMFLYVFRFPKYSSNEIAITCFSWLYAPLMLSFLYLTRAAEQGKYLVWLILISSWGCDTCAYVVGILIGKKKIFPVLSPKKSLEGCIGGVLGAALLGWLYAHFVMGELLPAGADIWIGLICAAGAVMSMVGDLAASGIKRNHEIKDYGHLIPGHGGIMDRFDSVIVTAPIVYFLSRLLGA